MCCDRIDSGVLSRARSKHGGVIAGRLGDHGVVFLAAVGGGLLRSPRLARSWPIERLRSLTLGFELHLGPAHFPPSASVSEHYQAALRAAEMALSKEVRFVRDAPQTERGPSPLGELRNELTQLAEQSPKALPAIRAISGDCGATLRLPARARTGTSRSGIREHLGRAASGRRHRAEESGRSQKFSRSRRQRGPHGERALRCLSARDCRCQRSGSAPHRCASGSQSSDGQWRTFTSTTPKV